MKSCAQTDLDEFFPLNEKQKSFYKAKLKPDIFQCLDWSQDYYVNSQDELSVFFAPCNYLHNSDDTVSKDCIADLEAQ